MLALSIRLPFSLPGVQGKGRPGWWHLWHPGSSRSGLSYCTQLEAMELTSSAKHREFMTGKWVQFCSWMRFPEQFCSLRFLESQGKVTPAVQL